ncbi:hypothetical protein HMI54_001012, partial [Coelomomyces lativittatus]
RKGKASVSEICISATLREQQRRKDELKKKAILQAKHLDCDKQTQLLEAQIQAQWETCFKTNSKLGNPYDLHQVSIFSMYLILLYTFLKFRSLFFYGP